MFPVGHLAYTWAALTWLQSHDKASMVDYWGAAVAALLPDLIDKPLSLTIMANSGTSQGIAHTLLAQALLSMSVARIKPEWLPYALISAGHLLADQMWKYPRTLFYPFSGQLDSWKFVGTPTAMLRAYTEIATRPEILAIEAVGLALLGWVVGKGQLYRKRALLRLLASGRLPLPAPTPSAGHEEL
jgi:hypothetical protein